MTLKKKAHQVRNKSVEISEMLEARLVSYKEAKMNRNHDDMRLLQHQRCFHSRLQIVCNAITCDNYCYDTTDMLEFWEMNCNGGMQRLEEELNNITL